MTPEEIVTTGVGSLVVAIGGFIRWSLGRELKRKEDDIQANRAETESVRLSIQGLREEMDRRADACLALTERYRDQFEKRKQDTDGVIVEYRSRVTKLEDRVDNTGPILIDLRQALASNTSAVTNLQAVLERVKEFMDNSRNDRVYLRDTVQEHEQKLAALDGDMRVIRAKVNM
jgi:chromosome segregation ATPase